MKADFYYGKYPLDSTNEDKIFIVFGYENSDEITKIYEAFSNNFMKKYGQESDNFKLVQKAILPYLIDEKGRITVKNSGVVGGTSIPDEYFKTFLEDLIMYGPIDFRFNGASYNLFTSEEKENLYNLIKNSKIEQEQTNEDSQILEDISKNDNKSVNDIIQDEKKEEEAKEIPNEVSSQDLINAMTQIIEPSDVLAQDKVLDNVDNVINNVIENEDIKQEQKEEIKEEPKEEIQEEQVTEEITQNQENQENQENKDPKKDKNNFKNKKFKKNEKNQKTEKNENNKENKNEIKDEKKDEKKEETKNELDFSNMNIEQLDEYLNSANKQLDNKQKEVKDKEEKIKMQLIEKIKKAQKQLQDIDGKLENLNKRLEK